MTIFRHIFLISCNFFIFYRNKLLSFVVMNSRNFFYRQLQRNDQTLRQNIENNYRKMWRNMVPLAKYGSLLYLLAPLLTLDNRGPSPHGFTSKMCWCIAEMLVLNSADDKLSQKDSCIQWFQSLRSVLGLFLCRGQTSYFYFRFHRNW